MLIGLLCRNGVAFRADVKDGNAARIAWLKDGIASVDDVKNGVSSNKFTGDWVVMTVPASNGIQQYTICQGVPLTGNYANQVIAAYFTNKNYEMAVLIR